MSDVLYDHTGRIDWQATRRRGVGASEVSILFGLAPASWGSVYSLWCQKTGRLDRIVDDGADYFEIGRRMEPVVADMYASRTKRELWNGGGPYTVAIDSELDVLRATPDRWVLGAEGMPGNGVLECKNVGKWAAREWEDEVPPHVECQLQTQLACTGYKWGSVAAITDGNAFVWRDVMRNEDFINEIRAHVSWFWNLVKTDTPPPIDGSEATAKAIRRLHPHDSGDEVALTFEHAIAWDRLREMKDEIAAVTKSHKAALGEAENTLKAAIGSATFGRLTDGRRLSLKTIERAGYQVEPTMYRTLKLEKEGKR